MIAASLCMFEGLMLLAVGLGRLSPQKLVILYNQLLSSPVAFKSIQIVGVFFIALGFLVLLLASRTKAVPKMISIDQDGKVLNIAYHTVIDFIEQVGSQDPFVTHFKANFINSRKEGIIIPIEVGLSGVPSVQQVLDEMENTLRGEIENVFGLKKIKFDFNIQGVSIDPKKKYFQHPELKTAPKSVEEIPVAQVALPVQEERPKPARVKEPVLKAEDFVDDDLSLKRSDEELEELIEVDHKNAKRPSLLKRMLWGK